MAKSWTVPNFNPNMALSVCLQKTMNTRCHELFSRAQGLREGSVDAIHDVRITCRRLLVLYEVFCGCIKKKKLKRYKAQVKDIHRLTGNVREYDVKMDFLGKCLNIDTKPEPIVVTLLYSRYSALRSAEHKKLIQAFEKLKKENIEDKYLNAIDKAFS